MEFPGSSKPIGSALTVLTLTAPPLEPFIDKNEHAEHALEILCKVGFNSIYSLITTLLRSNSLRSEESCQIALALLVNKENQNHFLEDNCFCQAICKYTLAITSQEMKALVAHKALQLPILKVNVEMLGKFDASSIVRYQRHCAPLITSVLRTCMGMKSVENDQEFQSNDEEDGLKLGGMPPQEIPED